MNLRAEIETLRRQVGSEPMEVDNKGVVGYKNYLCWKVQYGMIVGEEGISLCDPVHHIFQQPPTKKCGHCRYGDQPGGGWYPTFYWAFNDGKMNGVSDMFMKLRKLSSNPMVEDSIAWKLTKSGNCFLKSFYMKLMKLWMTSMPRIWDMWIP